MSVLKDKRIIVGVTGGIAAYKAAELVRQLTKEGAQTEVAMTRNATRFITPLTFEALTGRRVVWDMWDRDTLPMDHLTWGQDPDLIIIAPATANFVGKMAHGLGDDFLSTMVIAASARILVCPAMNTQMYQSAVVQGNIQILRARGYGVMEPPAGELACRVEGPGRLPEPVDIVEEAEVLLSGQDLSGLKVLVTAGPTVEPMDPVRLITNRSSGKMGYALARAARRRGAHVILVSGPTHLRPPAGVMLHCVHTAEEMKRAVFDHQEPCDIIIKAAAVSDYRPKERAGQKIKKGEDFQFLELIQNPDILLELGREKGREDKLLIGFAAETEDLLDHGGEKLRKKNLDMIVINDVTRDDAGFESDTNIVRIIYRDGHQEDLPLMEKGVLADHILDRIRDLRKRAS